KVDEVQRLEGRGGRIQAVHELHVSVVRRFINSPGFGVTRKVRPNRWSVELPDVRPIPLPTEDEYFKKLAEGRQPAAGPGEPAGAAAGGGDLWKMHEAGVVDFVNPAGFGHVKDRDHVAGFVPHRFSRVPDVPPAGRSTWRVLSVELVSLLKH